MKMKKLLKRLENIYAAVAFAEAGEHDTAREILMEEKREQKVDRVAPRQLKQMRAPGIQR